MKKYEKKRITDEYEKHKNMIKDILKKIQNTDDLLAIEISEIIKNSRI